MNKNTLFLLLCIIPAVLVGSIMAFGAFALDGMSEAGIGTFLSQFGAAKWVWFGLMTLVFTALIWFIIVIFLKAGAR